MKGIFKLCALGFVATAVPCAPAAGQYMPHLDPNLYMLVTMNSGTGASPCMTGTPMADAKIVEARASTLATMQHYFGAAQGGSGKSAAFLLDKKTAWQLGGSSVGHAAIDGQSDPLAVAGNRLKAEPLRFYRGGTGATALGQWAVFDVAGQIAGVYTGFFVRSKKEWKLRELTLSRAEDSLSPVAQYCVKPGDVLEHRLSSTKTWRENAEKMVMQSREKLAAASTRVSKQEAALAAHPRDKNIKAALLTSRTNQERLAKQLAKRDENLADAAKKLVEAENDAAEIARLTGPARNALAFRVASGTDPDEAKAQGN